MLAEVVRAAEVAQNSGVAQPIPIAGLDTFLWGIVETLKAYTVPVSAISIAAIGMALTLSGDSVDRKSTLKNWITNILIGGFLVGSATTIALDLKGRFGW
jgi:hypothetical protein